MLCKSTEQTSMEYIPMTIEQYKNKQQPKPIAKNEECEEDMDWNRVIIGQRLMVQQLLLDARHLHALTPTSSSSGEEEGEDEAYLPGTNPFVKKPVVIDLVEDDDENNAKISHLGSTRTRMYQEPGLDQQPILY